MTPEKDDRYTEERPVPYFIYELGKVQELFLDPSLSLEQQEKQMSKALDAIWKTAYTILETAPNISSINLIPVPSLRLVELGLLSEDTAGAILQDVKRKAEEKDVYDQIELRRSDAINQVFVIKTYMVLVDGLIHHMVKETILLEKQPDGQTKIVEISSEKQKMHMHLGEERWVLEDQQIETPIKVLPTPKRINTTLALLVEGFAPGFI